jgi:hypothetical protein
VAKKCKKQLDQPFLVSEFFPAKIFSGILEKGNLSEQKILAGKNSLSLSQNNFGQIAFFTMNHKNHFENEKSLDKILLYRVAKRKCQYLTLITME